MFEASPKDLKLYFQEARRWEEDRLATLIRSRRRAWILASASGVLCLASVGAVAALAPLKTVEPFVVRVDRATGAVEVMRGLSEATPLRFEEAVSKYFLGRYVIAREGYLDAAAEDQFRTVSVMSAPTVRRHFAEVFRGSNPDSPQQRFGAAADVLIDIRAVSFIEERVAQVRFRRVIRSAQQAVESDWIATVVFDWSARRLSDADRQRNPLGFQVQSYRVDPEVAP